MPTATLETPLAPPEERFWKRYSPRGEAPLGISGSLAVHVLIGGALLLAGAYFASLLYKPDRKVPVEVVRLGMPGKPPGNKDGGGVPGPVDQFEDDIPGEPGDPLPGGDKAPRAPPLTPVEKKRLIQKFEPPDAKILDEARPDALAKLRDSLGTKLGAAKRAGERVGPPTGTKDGKGDRPGKKGDGGGKLKLTEAQRRALRWHLTFTANTGQDYLAQLKGLGAILAFPVTEGADPEYKVVRDLRPGGKLLDEDVSQIQRIYWIDDSPKAVTDVVSALGVKLEKKPGRFVAFMPKKLEKEMFEMEKRHVEKVLERKYDEERIYETRFRCVKTAKGYRVELIRVTLKAG